MDSREPLQRESIERDAADWLAKRDSGYWSGEDQAALSTWLAASTANRVEYLRLEAAWEEANRLHAMGAGLEPGVIPSLEKWRAAPFFRHAPRIEESSQRAPGAPGDRSVNRRRLRGFAWAAGIVLFAMGAAFFHLNRNAYSTEVGATRTVPMPDGSQITLNTASHIRIDVSDTERAVKLDRGEAYFEVAQDQRRPFVVIAGKHRITALGTAFSVRRDASDDIQVAVTEGKVAVASAEAHDDANGHAGKPLQLEAGSVAMASRKNVRVLERPLPQIEETLSWRTGFIVFHDTPLADAVAEFNRYHARQVVIEDPALATIPVSGNFRASNIDAFTRLLVSGFGIRVAEEGDRILLRH